MAISLNRHKTIPNSIDVRQEETTDNNPCYIVDKKLIDSVMNNVIGVDEDNIRNKIAIIATSTPDIRDAFVEIKNYIYMVEAIDAIKTETIKYENREDRYKSPVE